MDCPALVKLLSEECGLFGLVVDDLRAVGCGLLLSDVREVSKVDALRVDEVAEVEVVHHEFFEVAVCHVSEVSVVGHEVVLFQVSVHGVSVHGGPFL